jgi:hypothetical protein
MLAVTLLAALTAAAAASVARIPAPALIPVLVRRVRRR